MFVARLVLKNRCMINTKLQMVCVCVCVCSCVPARKWGQGRGVRKEEGDL